MRKYPRWFGVAAIGLAATTGCGSRTSADFPAGIDNNLLQDQIAVAWPACTAATDPGCSSATDPYPETLATEISGTSSGYGWAHGIGYLKTPIATVWNKLQIAQGVVQLSFYPERDNSSCDAGLNVETGYDVSFETHEVPNGAIQSHYDFSVTFREGVLKGTETAPEAVGVVYKKTWGATSPGVQTLAGSIIFTAVTPDVTSIEMIRHLSATNTNGGPQARSWITEYYAVLKEVLAGTPPPDFVRCSGAGYP